MLWLPKYLQWFRWDAEKHREMDIKLYMSLMNQVRRKMAEGTAQPSMATLALGKQADFGLTEVETAYTLASPWNAGVGTVSSGFSGIVDRCPDATSLDAYYNR